MTWEQIDRDWLSGQKIAPAPDAVVVAFDIVDRLLGREWMMARRIAGGTLLVGTLPTLAVVSMGRRLQSVEGCVRADLLLDRIRAGDPKAASELTAIYLARPAQAALEIASPVRVGNRERVPDFRLAAPDEPWIYSEVSAPDPSQTHKEVERILDRLSNLLSIIPEGTALDLVFLKHPSESELSEIQSRLINSQSYLVPQVEPFGDLAIIAINQGPPGQIVPQDYGTPSVPRIGHARAEIVAGKPMRHVSARIPFIDNRAKEFLSRESEQLPTEFPGVIMFDMANAATGMREWTATIRQRLQPKMHTRVGAVCLFHAGMQSTVHGEDWVLTSHIITNPNARHPLPKWMMAHLARFAAK